MKSSSWSMTSWRQALLSNCWSAVEFFAREIEAVPFHVFVIGHPADGRFAAKRAAAGAVDDPFEYAHVFAVAGPDEFAVGIFAEPVHVENARRDA